MSVTDPFSGWDIDQDENLPAGNQIPNTMDDEIRNIKAEVKINAVALSGNQTVAGVKTFSSIPVGPTATDPTTDNQLARKGYVDGVIAAEVTNRNTAVGTRVATTGDETVAGVKTFSSIPLLPASDPTTDNQAARKAYVDSMLVAPSMAILQNRRAQNTGGGTATAGTWQIVPINTEFEDADGIVDSTSLPAFSLAAGTYQIEVISPFRDVYNYQTRLYNVTDGAVQANIASNAMLGSSGYASGYHETNFSHLLGTITIAGTKQLRLEYYVGNSQVDNGLGTPGNFAVEVYAQIKITKIA